MLATILASSLAFVDGSVINVALPSIGHGLDASAADLQWTINAYLLPLSALILLGGAAGDRFGRRRMLLIGLVIFALASIACALAPSLAVLLPARAVQGVGAAMLMPNSLAILGNAFSGEQRGRAIGTWAAVGAIAAAVGPPLGGWLVEVAGWRTIFYINIPLAIGAFLIASRYVRESGDGDRPLDWLGALTVTSALGALTWSLTRWSSNQSADNWVWIGTFIGVALLALFLYVEGRLKNDAMMPLTLFGSKEFVGLTLLTFLLYSALGGVFVLVPYMLIEAAHYSPVQAGAALLPFSVILGTVSRPMGRLSEKTGPRWLLTIGPIVTAAGFAVFASFDPQSSYWKSVFPAMVVIAAGMACAVAPLTSAVLSSVDDKHTGTASGFNSAIARTGGLIATALAGAVIAHTGAELTGAFRIAALTGAALAFASGLVAYFSLRGSEKLTPNK